MDHRDVPGGPMVKTLTSNSGSVDSIPGRRTIIPQAVQIGQIFFKKGETLGQKQYLKKW